MELLNVPVAVDFSDTGFTVIPLNVNLRRDVCAKPMPDTPIVDPGRPDVGLSVIDVDVVMMWFVSNVTAPVSAINLPSIDAPVVAVIDARAIIVPLKTEYVPRVAELPTCQKTFEDDAPLVRTILLAPGPAAVVSVLPILKMYTPLPESVSVPVMAADDGKQ